MSTPLRTVTLLAVAAVAARHRGATDEPFADSVLNIHIAPHTHNDAGWLKHVDQVRRQRAASAGPLTTLASPRDRLSGPGGPLLHALLDSLCSISRVSTIPFNTRASSSFLTA